jgi:hypothetical protein
VTFSVTSTQWAAHVWVHNHHLHLFSHVIHHLVHTTKTAIGEERVISERVAPERRHH